MVEFMKAFQEAQTIADLENIIRGDMGGTGLLLFFELDRGTVLRKETRIQGAKIVRLLIDIRLS